MSHMSGVIPAAHVNGCSTPQEHRQQASEHDAESCLGIYTAKLS